MFLQYGSENFLNGDRVTSEEDNTSQLINELLAQPGRPAPDQAGALTNTQNPAIQVPTSSVTSLYAAAGPEAGADPGALQQDVDLQRQAQNELAYAVDSASDAVMRANAAVQEASIATGLDGAAAGHAANAFAGAGAPGLVPGVLGGQQPTASPAAYQSNALADPAAAAYPAAASHPAAASPLADPNHQATVPATGPGSPATASGKPHGKPVILFDRVSKVYPAQPNKPALANITIQVHPGEFVFLVGHSGSGKSTFIRLINHEIKLTTGKIVVAGEDLVRIRNWRIPYLRRNIGCVFQDYKLLPNKTAFENVAFALEVIGKSRHIIRTQVPEVLRLVGLEDKITKLPDQLSGGEQQRVSIARAIVNRPPLLICDEPTGNLDPQTSLGIMRLLDRINRTGTTVLVATHDREMVDSLRKRVIALENGYLVRDQDRGVYGLDA